MIDRLRQAFPRIQFIVSTHSPVVLSNFKQDDNNIVYQLGRNNDKTTKYAKLPNSYGIDYNSLLENQMEAPVRNSMLSELISAYRYWKDAGDSNRMSKLLELIIDKVGDDNELVIDLQK